MSTDVHFLIAGSGGDAQITNSEGVAQYTSPRCLALLPDPNDPTRYVVETSASKDIEDLKKHIVASQASRITELERDLKAKEVLLDQLVRQNHELQNHLVVMFKAALDRVGRG